MDAVPGQGPAVEGDSMSPAAPWRTVNIGNSTKVRLEDFIDAIEAGTGRAAIRNCMDMQPGDVPATWANTDPMQFDYGHLTLSGAREVADRLVAAGVFSE